jgi:hypothetical protein
MKKLVIIVFVVISAVAAAASIKKSNINIEAVKQQPTQILNSPRSTIVSNWD